MSNQYDVEPTVQLPSGRQVLQAIYESIDQLIATGHEITVDDGNVFVSPAINSDWHYVLQSMSNDVEAILDAHAGSIH